jgi:hypothetical protein
MTDVELPDDAGEAVLDDAGHVATEDALPAGHPAT